MHNYESTKLICLSNRCRCVPQKHHMVLFFAASMLHGSKFHLSKGAHVTCDHLTLDDHPLKKSRAIHGYPLLVLPTKQISPSGKLT